MNTASYNGDVLPDKQEIGGILKFFHDNFKDITFHEGVGSKINQSNGFYLSHIEIGKKIVNKYHAVVEFNNVVEIV